MLSSREGIVKFAMVCDDDVTERMVQMKGNFHKVEVCGAAGELSTSPVPSFQITNNPASSKVSEMTPRREQRSWSFSQPNSSTKSRMLLQKSTRLQQASWVDSDLVL